ncbi:MULTISPECIES: bifunctional O-antigen ligase/aminoglycoside phosphotransferase family protein [unclassified Pseudomonas]|uniref:bifunctional O-antigen ligase/aminoglycoside phosphotransferase family protein n=1 Tax=unclassified Pseudomonas TaxID=196821 RepID=UPI000838EB23|nr:MULTISPECIES: bifunctional O-antigen ligase/aminoglycoside phosphotransferase family protein [unclassified Pseudomonas]QIH05845.1 polymerase [Pseudomonas sp. BIOMIG1BAC]
MSCALRNLSNRVFDFICLWILPTGYLLLLCALFFLPERSLLHKLYYGLFSIPTLIALCLRPAKLKSLLREPIFIAVLLFCIWALISLAWSPPVDSLPGEFKPPAHLLMLFAGCSLLVSYRLDVLRPLCFCAAMVALVASLINLYTFSLTYTPGARMIGGGAFDNPLLSSHVFGFFLVYWLWLSMSCQRMRVLLLSIPAMAVMFAAILATGSRTPLVALTLAIAWICFMYSNKRSLMLLTAMLTCSTAVLLLFSHMLGERGNSYRFEIWTLVLGYIAEHPWIGHGFNANLSVDVNIGYLLEEPHNFALGVLYYVGIVGLVPWLFMQAWGLFKSWQLRSTPLVVLASSWLVFGIGAGLTEGGGVLSRPKEHWFLLWIPLALIAALCIAQRARRTPPHVMQTLAPAALEQLTCDAQVIESDGLGPKVMRLNDGSFLKLFRPRRWYTSGGFNPYSERFASNSEQLGELGIVTPNIMDLYRLADGSSAVRYQPLAGQTLRHCLQVAGSADERAKLVRAFGAYMASLHEHGVYFRSLHLANVLVLESGGFGLIDLADLRVYPSPLRSSLRQRNLRHMQRYAEDNQWLFHEHLDALRSGYAQLTSANQAQVLLKAA